MDVRSHWNRKDRQLGDGCQASGCGVRWPLSLGSEPGPQEEGGKVSSLLCLDSRLCIGRVGGRGSFPTGLWGLSRTWLFRGAETVPQGCSWGEGGDLPSSSAGLCPRWRRRGWWTLRHLNSVLAQGGAGVHAHFHPCPSPACSPWLLHASACAVCLLPPAPACGQPTWHCMGPLDSHPSCSCFCPSRGDAWGCRG